MSDNIIHDPQIWGMATMATLAGKIIWDWLSDRRHFPDNGNGNSGKYKIDIDALVRENTCAARREATRGDINHLGEKIDKASKAVDELTTTAAQLVTHVLELKNQK